MRSLIHSPLNATFSRTVNHRSIIKRLLRVMDVRQGVLERNAFKMVYLYNELAALRHRTEEFEALAYRALTVLKGRTEPEIQPLIEELHRMRPDGTGKEAEDAPLANRALHAAPSTRRRVRDLPCSQAGGKYYRFLEGQGGRKSLSHDA